jgi:predicted acylesterase/phospholipase RssA
MNEIAIVLSGGGARAAYQVGALKALAEIVSLKEQPIGVIVGSSIGAVNGLVLSAGLSVSFDYSVEKLSDLWLERNFRNTFSNHPSLAFFRAINLAISQTISPGPSPSASALFNPSPLRNLIDKFIDDHGGLSVNNRSSTLHSIGIMTTIEGLNRSPLLLLSSSRQIDELNLSGATFAVSYIDSLRAAHGLASAALPSILPPVELDYKESKISLVDGGISENVPVDPAVRLGGEIVYVIDISGRDWWHNRSGKPHDARPNWEVPSPTHTFCSTPNALTALRCQSPLGVILRNAVGKSTKKFIKAVGPVWPLYSLLKNRMGTDVAYEVMSYVALDTEYSAGLIELGYNETKSSLASVRVV